MKNNIKKITIFLLLIFLTTGCTTQLKNVDNELVKNETTGQTLVKNILCQPESEETIQKYNETLESAKVKLQEELDNNEITQIEYNQKSDNLVDISSLPKCSEFNLTDGGYEGLWMTIFVKPLAWLILKVGELVGNYGLSILIITLLIRLCLFPITQKTAKQSEQMKLAKPELDKIEKKYTGKTDQQSVMAKSQETMLVYKNFKINPVSGCIFAVIQIPLFFAFYEALNRLPAIFEERFLGIQLGTTALTGITSGKYYYIIIVILVIAATYFSMKLNKTATIDSEQAKTMKMMTNIMIIMISIASFTISTGITLYWIMNNLFTIVQNLIVKRRKENA
ncbi:MAG: YidC/Oxa1 family membrane protein insertase [Bacilli bacterium]|nr:YidC/Oxa1 family membrane protein insertase [Bacilli bacterium]